MRRRQLLDAAVLAYQESLKLTQVQHDTGIASDQDVAQAETQLNTTRAQATDLGIQRAQLEHAIATLLGKPASIIFHRDKSAGRKTHRDSLWRSVAIARTPSRRRRRRTPRRGGKRANRRGARGLFSDDYFERLGGIPEFVAGESCVGAKALFGQWARRWRKHFLTPENAKPSPNKPGRITRAPSRTTVRPCSPLFRKSKTIYRRCESCQQELQQQDAAVESSQRYLTLANDRYKFGIDSYLNVITAQTTLLSNQRTAMNLRMQQMTASVQLIKALGGGWDVSQSTTAAIP